MENAESQWLKSKEVERALKISSCDLMHMRLGGKLRFQKKGNAYLYDVRDVARASKEKTS